MKTVRIPRVLAASWTPCPADLASGRERANLESEMKRAIICETSKTVGIVGRFLKSGIHFLI
jgi:hypothetical protein